MSSNTQSSVLEPPPPYVACTADDEAPGNSPTTRQESTDDILEGDEDVAGSASASQPPPPFSLTPGTFVLAPQSVVIQSPVAGARPLYQLSRPLNGYATETCLIDVPAGRKLKEDGTLRAVRLRDELYGVHQLRMPYGVLSREVVITARHRDQFGEVRLRKGVRVGLGGLSCTFEATSVADDKAHGHLLYHTKQKKKGVMEWHDGSGTLVAVETPAVDTRVDAETLEIVVPLDKRHLDLMVVLWISRIYQDTQLQGAIEDKQAAKKRKADQKQLDKAEGRPSGVLHDMKEALGIGYGLKPGSTRMGGMFTAPPALKDNGRINWSGH